MTRILVTTDFSDNSIAGVRFAIQLAHQSGVELIFLHVPEIWKSDIYRNHTVHTLSGLETKREGELDAFVRHIYQSMKIVPGKYQCIIYSHIGIVLSIIDYAVKNSCEYICISTHGAGNIEKYVGTNTGELIRQSPVPVLCIPKDYNPHTINSVLYASDLIDYKKEIEKVIAFSSLMGAEVHVVHFSSKFDNLINEVIKAEDVAKKSEYNVQFHSIARDISKSLIKEVDEAVDRLLPSILIMFTEQNRSFFENLFLSSKTEGYSFITKVPLLAFKKT